MAERRTKRRKKSSADAAKSGTAERADEPLQGGFGHRRLPFLVVGIGASAGGLAAFEKVFSRMPPDGGLALILVPHLAAKHKSSMGALRRRGTRLHGFEVPFVAKDVSPP